ncbi:hypothetical protein U9M48_018306 [Paspalum notatum var. saurae]|uniref:Reverse transcriptase domain-containing protein n=1 Tax=Paspalum notatum var. saurae TaxID=547442 RepID=A0AAQ3T9V5_PASNO
MQHLGFGRVWCNLISLLLSTSFTRLLINGDPGEYIGHRRGLRQGDPLSPMLFILVMENLNALISYADRKHLLQPIASHQAKHRISTYADDVVMFLRPTNQDITTVTGVLEIFGHATGLRTNISKSSVTPIQCGEDVLATISELLPCEIKNFPCTYLGLPLSIRKLTNADFLPLIDKVADKLPGWKASLLCRASRLVLVKAVLSSIPVYLMLALDLPKWVLKAIDRIRRSFLWKGQANANGGNCLVSWNAVQLQFGGLGILNLELMAWALRIRWLWLQKTDPSKPWAGLPVQVHRNAKALFDVAVVSVVGNGETIKFWTDRWLQGKNVAEHCPTLFKLIPKRAVKQRTVTQGVTDRKWVSDISGALSVQVLVEYLRLWSLIEGVELRPDVADKHQWRFASHGSYSSKSAYEAFFVGSITFAPWRRVWKTWAPLRCKFFIWLVFKKRLWTADRLAKRGLPHPAACPLCDKSDETIQHLLISCVFAREVWTAILSKLGLAFIAPQPGCTGFTCWWRQSVKRVGKDMRKGLNSLIILVAWQIWKHRNSCVFEGTRPCVQSVVLAVVEEGRAWCLAGASALHDLLLQQLPSGRSPYDGIVKMEQPGRATD